MNNYDSKGNLPIRVLGYGNVEENRKTFLKNLAYLGLTSHHKRQPADVKGTQLVMYPSPSVSIKHHYAVSSIRPLIVNNTQTSDGGRCDTEADHPYAGVTVSMIFLMGRDPQFRDVGFALSWSIRSGTRLASRLVRCTDKIVLLVANT